MRIYDNGVIREMTPEEITEIEEANVRYEAEEKKHPLSTEEVQTMFIRQQINTLTVDDATAYRMLAFYPEWESGKAYTSANSCLVGYKVTHGGKLYKLRQEHTSQDGWEPGATGAESLWEEICEQHDGSKYDPIPYSGNMVLENGKYYTQSGILYLCTRDTGNPVYHALSGLVGIYVTAV